MNIGNRHSQHSFATQPDVKMARSQFDRSFPVKDTFDFDYLVPIFVDEILPGDTVNLSLNAFARLATQKVPIMDNLYIDYFWFFVPNRLVMNNWEKLNGAQTNPGDSTSYICPQMTFPAGGPEVDSLADKFGLPTDVAAGYTIKNCLPFRCYNLIWNQWFRDENLQNSVVVDLDDGPDAPTDYVLLKRGRRHDYFASALPWPQKGSAVSLPLGTTADVKMKSLAQGNPAIRWKALNASTLAAVASQTAFTTNASGEIVVNPAGVGVQLEPANGELYADLSTATAATINQLREAFQMQSLFELDARGGTRYVEILQAHFNVTSPDFRLQRAEYLGGGQSRINSHPVAQTAPTAGANPQGQLAAFATSQVGGNIGFTKSFVEHGYVIGLACARADVTYQQGINRMWNRSTRYDFFWPKLQELGEQAILNKEIYTQGTAADELVFGYQERYAEYRFRPGEIHGKFRSTYATPLDMWHMAEKFTSLPALNATFIQQNTPIDRAIAITTEPDLLFDAFFQYKHSRPMMAYSTPLSLGRF